MKAARFYRSGEMLRIEETKKPVLAEGTAIIKVRAAGVCGTDLHFIHGLVNVDAPLILGHEIAGDIESIKGSNDFAEGDRVVIYTMQNCGCCKFCRSGLDSICPNRKKQIGFNVDGGFAEYVKTPVENLVHLPENVSYQEASVLACSGMTALHAARLSNIRLGHSIVVNGVGGVGIMVIQVCRIAGGKVIAIADDKEKVKIAENAGAEKVIFTGEYSYPEVPTIIKDITDGRGTDYFIDLIGTNETVNAGIDALAGRGRIVLIGYTNEDLVISPSKLIHNELQILSSLAATKDDLSEVIDMAKRKLLKPIITEELSLDDINIALKKIENREALGRSVIVFP